MHDVLSNFALCKSHNFFMNAPIFYLKPMLARAQQCKLLELVLFYIHFIIYAQRATHIQHAEQHAENTKDGAQICCIYSLFEITGFKNQFERTDCKTKVGNSRKVNSTMYTCPASLIVFDSCMVFFKISAKQLQRKCSHR